MEDNSLTEIEGAHVLPPTEQENPRTRDIASLDALSVVRLMNDEDSRVAEAVGRVLGDVARVVEGVVNKLSSGGRLFYVGTGTSGRLGVLDAAECAPTFGVPPGLVQGVIAGGYEALHRATEASEDDREAGGRDLEARGVGAGDAVIGIAASGRTPYTVGAIEHARSLGAFTAAVTCVPASPLTRAAEVSVVPEVGPEVIAGSTRLKAGTAQKMVLNMISTATMIRLGYVTGNRMSNLLPRNDKLRARSLRILREETGVDEAAARDRLAAAGGDLRVALVMHATRRAREEAESALAQSRGAIKWAVELLNADRQVQSRSDLS